MNELIREEMDKELEDLRQLNQIDLKDFVKDFDKEKLMSKEEEEVENGVDEVIETTDTPKEESKKKSPKKQKAPVVFELADEKLIKEYND